MFPQRAAFAIVAASALVSTVNAQTKPADPHRALVNQYCVGCHNNKLNTAGVSLEGVDLNDIHGNAALLEKVLRKVKSSQMPPPGLPRPEAATLTSFSNWLDKSLDAEALDHPDPGHPSVHRLNRAEYSNAVRDLLALDVHPGDQLPVDDSGYGFDNIGDVLTVSPALLDRYISVGRKVARLAVGDMTMKPGEEAFEPRKEPNRGVAAAIPARREWVSEDLPFDAAGGLAVPYYFPLDAEYNILIRFGNVNNPGSTRNLELRLPIKAGRHIIGATFPGDSLKPEIDSLGGRGRGNVLAGAPPPVPTPMDLFIDGARVKRFDNAPGGGNGLPQIGNLAIIGPYNATGRGDTPAREKIFTCKPANAAEETACAQKILSTLSRRAYRRPVTDADVRPLLAFYQSARGTGAAKADFDYGIERALEAMLVSPDFLFRAENDPKPGPHHITDVELASRLSFFLWSSIPDDQLLDLAAAGKLSNPAVLKQQVSRMLDDPKSDSLTANFAGQWLFIRNLDQVKPDPVIFSDFDESLRYAMRQETELFFQSTIRENRSALELLTANYTYLNERLANHYGIPNIYGSQFRRVELTDANRGGLLGQASLLTVTSPPNRTSVVTRGKWILDNLLGTPPPPPPPNVPPLEATTDGPKKMTLREAMELHRANPVCNSCHSRMDPIGFALENYDGIGKWRSEDKGAKIDASGKLADGVQFDGPAGLKKLLTTTRRDDFVGTVAEKLLTYGLGRGVEYYDRPALREILSKTEPNGYRMQDLITAIVESTPFQMRRSANQ